MLTSGVVLLHDNARPHAAAPTRALLERFNWVLFDHLTYSPDLALSDNHLFIHLKNWLRSQRFSSNEELMEGAKTWLSSQMADFFDIGKKKTIPRYDKCLNSGGDYVEKLHKYVNIFLYNKIFSRCLFC
jgi:histone-lysine N-methyltransferase SETMAR